ncbi:MAG: N-acetyl-gamma-glutamyl-phosphate reductase [Pseudodesulfovibrio sp.]|uniref:N-acetyl-gamma-glutamyl-phosphate reductase n=1 Tax=Pseudodesulfovibrio aespoeensis (strain ATCC 700646 / DSM 10631 / Aspo-2) TaxID=643562 RepID=E6VSL8_PSEA9|nr:MULTISPECIES: N-acetyl-gamma-glutamyl-phosphate reductase [Pseudodesulfovibrio]MBU4191289.1 N-acetyl-gamma-glutamyl-phosphate reductase [Pseudomonadota bacterium]ADU62003.1 N-acetyl-gamma-glutamyl-phosphate reductase [Pseudodesulfovibrio aespoeensis Aspo-2]MBU4245296.1 N-acetyl-gamma-glutamyl-phosphate reductase [Pseudomonadota bacterium]MBU4379472.1 N-acetyl-gamma-glutamyl-phosphate reductase [Pseudomonadota bacterium]MBU4474926.1 N-acetyl-gamma-glutamyl-phosphate reductase [Pseudomonadota
MSHMIKAGLVGVTGYTGMELARLMVHHSSMELVRVTSRAEAGKRLADIYPFLHRLPLGELVITRPDAADLAEECDVVFLAVPHKTAMEIAAELLELGVKVVDLSADFRLNDKAVYEQWYDTEHTRAGLLSEAVYGLPELYLDRIMGARLIANPGCYPTSAILGLAPALTAGLVETGDIVIDAKSGASGAGRAAKVGTLFCEVADSFRAYGLPTHRHTPEIEQELTKLAETNITVSFNTHLLPIDRGILSTIYTRLKGTRTIDEIHDIFTDFYSDKPLVRVLPKGLLPETRHVRGTVFCDLGLVVDPRTNRLIILSAIDNLCRGASGQALMNANLICGLDIDEGLPMAPMMP